jgi:hypothetical protein
MVVWLPPTAVEWKECGCTTGDGTVDGCPNTVEVGMVVLQVGCKPCGTLGEHH